MRNALRCCSNWKVVAGLGVVAVGIWAVRPDLVSSILPNLFVLVCPLSMVLMMFAMRRSQSSAEGSADTQSRQPITANDRVGELRERLERAQAEESVLESELARADAQEVSSDPAQRSEQPARGRSPTNT